MKLRTVAVTLGVLISSLLQIACGGSTSQGTPKGNVDAPIPAAPRAADGGGTSSVGTLWGYVADQVVACDFPGCPGLDGIIIRRDGTYYIGDPSLGQTGRLTTAELADFIPAADAVAAQGIKGDATCTTPELPLVGATTYVEVIAFSDQSKATVAKVSPTLSCYNGSQNLADALRSQFDTLERKYDPGRR